VLYVLGARMFGSRDSIKTLGTTNQMRKLIDKFFIEEDFKALKEKNKEVVVGSVNINARPSVLTYFSSLVEDFEDFKDWVWTSANAPFVTTLLNKKWYDPETDKWYMGEWTDGGLSELAPFNYILESGCNEIDIIIHRTRPIKIKERPLVADFLQNVERSIDAMRYDIEFKDGELVRNLDQFAKENNIKINIYWLPRQLAKNSLVFDKKVMLSWFEEGFKTAHNSDRIDILG
jgi:NTE family protein